MNFLCHLFYAYTYNIFFQQDGHEICFVGDEAFRELSKVDPKAGALLDKAIEEDGSAAWYDKKGKTKQDAGR